MSWDRRGVRDGDGGATGVVIGDWRLFGIVATGFSSYPNDVPGGDCWVGRAVHDEVQPGSADGIIPVQDELTGSKKATSGFELHGRYPVVPDMTEQCLAAPPAGRSDRADGVGDDHGPWRAEPSAALVELVAVDKQPLRCHRGSPGLTLGGWCLSRGGQLAWRSGAGE